MGDSPLRFAELLTAASMLGYSLFAWILAVRLLNMVRGTWSIPEASVAIGYLFIAGIGYPMVAASIGAWESLGETTSVSIQIVGGIILRVGLAGIFIFTWQTFRAEAGWAKAFAIAGILLLPGPGSGQPGRGEPLPAVGNRLFLQRLHRRHQRRQGGRRRT